MMSWKKKFPVMQALAAVLLIAAFFVVAGILLQHNWQWSRLPDYGKKFAFGFGVTVMISFFSLILSLIIGTLAAAGKRSEFLFVKYTATFYIELIRGTPLLVQTIFFFYFIGTAYNLNNRYLMGILILSTFSGAYVSEIIRAGLESIPSAQMESAKSLCFTRLQTYRYIIVPQVSRVVLPPLTGQFASLIKDSSILSLIAVNEFTKNVQEVDSITFTPFENYILLAVGYLVLTIPISLLTRRLERKMAYAN